MKRYLLILPVAVLLLFGAGWIASSLNAQTAHLTSTAQDNVYGIIYKPFPQPSPEQLTQAMKSVPPPKQGPVLSVEEAQRYLNSNLAVANCPSFMALQGVQLYKEQYPDGEIGLTIAQLTYEFKEEKILLEEVQAIPGSGEHKPNGANEIAIRDSTGWLLENWVPGKNEIWWKTGIVSLELKADKTIAVEDLIRMANCVQ